MLMIFDTFRHARLTMLLFRAIALLSIILFTLDATRAAITLIR